MRTFIASESGTLGQFSSRHRLLLGSIGGKVGRWLEPGQVVQVVHGLIVIHRFETVIVGRDNVCAVL
jgi:hypothetical protein